MRKIGVIAVLVTCILVGAHSDNKKSINYQKQSSEKFYQSQSGNNKEDNKAALDARIKNMQYIFPIEDPVRAKAGRDKYLVKVAIREQKVYVYKNGIEIRIMDCSTGLAGVDSDTPIDNYKINSYYGQSFYSNKYKEGARYWVGFSGAEYLFHSVPTGEDGQIIATQADMIGKKASHGCIRLSVDDAFWFYETIPEGADVVTGNAV
ncbi:L,D-transpeptidase [Clostridium lacusfryxellense]|uniref:L,D-transpeptidase n=1 Tax=Clostridium lacusfryxellense TaxID=205328 RepID=UPI001C0E74B8|nr:L,D-transpeptidase [Clostridium lacusfryxellense]MBU3113725.1 L,D-transpeptidase [Clostridium lacusfryxellense]